MAVRSFLICVLPLETVPAGAVVVKAPLGVALERWMPARLHRLVASGSPPCKQYNRCQGYMQFHLWDTTLAWIIHEGCRESKVDAVSGGADVGQRVFGCSAGGCWA